MASILKTDKIEGVTASGTVHIPGHVVQVQQGTYATQTDSSSSGTVATGLNVSITPTSANNKILISYSMAVRNNDTSGNYILFYLYRASSSIGLMNFFSSTNNAYGTMATGELLDTPSSTSSLLYEVHAHPRGYSAQWCSASCLATITAQEIAQ